MTSGGVIAGQNLAWPRVEIRLYVGGEDDPVHTITTGLTCNPSRRLGDVMPAVERFVRELQYATRRH